MMMAALSIPDVEKLVADSANQLDGGVTREGVHVYEDSSADDGSWLVVQIVARRPDNREEWTKRRVRFSQAIRDKLLARGDERYPVIEVFGPDEWARRND